MGLGTPDPTHKLTIKSEGYNDNLNLIGTKSQGPGITLTNDLDKDAYIYYAGSTSKNGEGSIGFRTDKDPNKFIIKESGNVGLGTNPLYKLHLSSGENKQTEIALAKNSEWGTPIIKFQPDKTDYISMGFTEGVNQTTKSNVDEALTINRYGAIGINTNKPKTNLHVKNDKKLNTWLGVSSNEEKLDY